MAAGVEGGSWDRIEEWTMDRAEAMNDFWRRNGPPLHVAVQAIGQSLGIDWKAGQGPSASEPNIASGPSIAEMAAMVPTPLA